MKRRRFIAGAIGVAVGGRVAYEKADVGPLYDHVSSDDGEVVDTVARKDGTHYRVTSTVANHDDSTIKFTVKFIPEKGPERVSSVTVAPEETEDITVEWDLTFHPSTGSNSVTTEITAADSLDDSLPDLDSLP